jgi:mannose-6-phosphate isomerase-like protein (cupin superfamily)
LARKKKVTSVAWTEAPESNRVAAIGDETEGDTVRLTPGNAQSILAAEGGKRFVELFHHGSLVVEYYRPVGVDTQQPHMRDEVYVVIAGTGYFQCGAERHPFEPGEVLFAAAGVEHRFEQFTPDFATWVFFYGPEGGEAKGG